MTPRAAMAPRPTIGGILLERFPAKWELVRRQEARQNKT